MTACGLALPPVAFITWPTNQPASAGFAFACSAFSGLAAIDLIDRLLDRAHVGDLGQPARLDDRGGLAAFRPHDVEHILGDLARDGAVLDQIEDRAELAGRDGTVGDAPCLPC